MEGGWVEGVRNGVGNAVSIVLGKPSAPNEEIPLHRSTDDMLAEELQHLGFVPPLEVGNTAPPSWQQVREHIQGLSPAERPAALCLSGGGIRSATFSLGVLQSLARMGKLGRFHYLSTVSGGGYLGSFFSALVAERGEAAARDNLAYDRPAGPGATDEVSRLRAYSNYLSPITGLSGDSVTLVSIFLRNLLLNLLVWLPFLCAVLFVPRLYLLALDTCIGLNEKSRWCNALAGLAAAAVMIGLAFIARDLPPPRPNGADRFRPLCFWPIFLAAILLTLAAAAAPQDTNFGYFVFALGAMGAQAIGFLGGAIWRQSGKYPPREVNFLALRLVALVASGCVTALPIWLVWMGGRALADMEPDARLPYATVAMPLMLVALWLGMAAHAGVGRRAGNEDEREWWSRAGGYWLFAAVLWMLLFAFVVFMPPLVVDWLGTTIPAGLQLGAGGALLGVLASAIGYWSKNGSDLFKKASGFVQAIGARMLDVVAGLSLVCLLLALAFGASALLVWLDAAVVGTSLQYPKAGLLQSQVRYLGAGAADSPQVVGMLTDFAPIYRLVLLEAHPILVLATAAGLLLTAYVVSRLIGANAFSLHGLYGNRLTRAYLGAVRDKRLPHPFTGFDPDDNRLLHEMRGQGGPFHIINIALNLVLPSDTRLAWQQRKAASFTATPLRCGSDCTGYVDSARYAADKGISLGRAMTISGAAASPNMGYHSSPLVTAVMTLFNVRLGWWLPNPKLGTDEANLGRLRAPEPPTGLRALLDEAGGRTTDDSASIYVSDGGHFDNIGLYEVVRRRCHCVVVVDATADGGYGYSDLLETVRRIRIDLGIRITLPANLPGQAGDARFARGASGTIHYRDQDPEADDGVLHLVKPVVRRQADYSGAADPQELLAYAASTEGKRGGNFPHQSTGDQFFDEVQFESYRQLGALTASEVLDRDLLGGIPPPPPREPPLPPPPGGADRAPASGMLAALQPATLAIAALAVGGTIGVAGTVTLSPSEISLSATDRALLARPAAVELRPSDELRANGVRLNAGEVTVALADVKARLAEAAGHLKTIAGALDKPALRDGFELVARRLESLDSALRDARALAQVVDAMPLAGQQPLAEVRRQLTGIEAAIRQVRVAGDTNTTSNVTEQTLSKLGEGLGRIEAAVKELNTTVKEGSPRRNVQGPEGARR